MKFTRLSLTGFKSFCDATDLHLEAGLSGVVGPNGCGKSNLVEALRWVMGESSYKAMRASGMDDVIFSGSGNRPGRNSAEVTLVLDNSDRTAPAHLNTADVLEVTRRIEREAGSVYRINGREVRARDVQLLFADASTGAHSPALVRQGQIGELIAAKPTQRRALLEEAAGISGLHSRRHEAELRLRAAEQNLLRVDDVVAQIEQQLETLKRQARLAVRYRSLSGDIRKAEATLFHLRWVKARVAEKEAEAEQGRLTRQLADATHLELEAQKVLFLARQGVQPRREAEAAAGAARQRLVILIEQADAERKRAAGRLADLQRRMDQAEADSRRETALVTESAEALARFAAEQISLEAEREGAIAALAEAREVAEAAADAAAQSEAAARTAIAALAAIRARRTEASRALADAEARHARLVREDAVAQRALADLEHKLAADDGVAARQAQLDAARQAALAAEAEAMAAEQSAEEAQEAVDEARPPLQRLDTALKGLETERTTLDRILKAGAGGGRWPAILEALTVEPGYEQALGAALGDDLEMPADARAPIHWQDPGPGTNDPRLPEGATPLAGLISGAPVLARRLAQIGLVAEADAERLVALLHPGQMLVTRTGATWRWDGLRAAADAPSAAAQRLAQRNRLAELDAEITQMWRERVVAAETATSAATALAVAREAETRLREGWRRAQTVMVTAQAGLDAAQKATGALATKRGALAEAARQLAGALGEAEGAVAAARAALEPPEAEAAASGKVREAEALVKEARNGTEQARLRLGGLETEARLREARLGQIGQERAAWEKRRLAAAGHAEELLGRHRALAQELEAARTAPDAHDERRLTLEAELRTAEAAWRAAGDALAQAETRFAEADTAQRLAAEGLSGTREQLGRVEERIAGLAAQRRQIERLVHETLGIEASRTAEAAGIRAQDALPDESETERRVDRLKAERERLGGVNLAAERESEEVREKLDRMVTDRDDLIAAIATLRSGIQSLNREGRARLSEAFDRVNAHFQELFTTLFGGGTAELRFVESDDPLEAGLEIFARPPGKKPTTMTLLSGGEQALTAMSLIFAVFLTNPAPICVLDEVDAPLDDANVERFCTLLDSMRKRTETRFLVITHNPITMSRVDRLYGVTMAERGVSQLVSVDLRQAEAISEAG